MSRTISQQAFMWGYLCLFVLLSVTNNNIIGFAICALTIIGLVTKSVSIELALMVSLTLNNELTCTIHLLICVVFIVSEYRIKFGKVNKKIAICVTVLLISSLINMVISGGFWGPIFGIVYYIFILFFAKALKCRLVEEKLFYSAKCLLMMEFVVSIVNLIVSGSFQPGDVHKGTFPNAHFFAFWLLCILIYLFIYNKEIGYTFFKNIKSNIKWYVIGLFCIVLSDGKNVLAGFILALLVYGFSFAFSRNTKNRIILSILLLYIGTYILLLFFLHLDSVKWLINTNFPNVSIYIYDSMFAYKFRYFEGTIFEELNGLRVLFGFGIGQYGSRFANLLGYAYMYREDSFINNFVADHFASFILPNYAKYASMYSKELVNVIQWRSAVLSYPFSSIIAFLAENGVIGLAFMTYMWGKWANKSKYGMIVVFLFASCVFDIYFDRISLLALVLVLVSERKNSVILKVT